MALLLSIGQLAARTGLTVRALRHYDDLGLLAPTERTAAGHRRYGPEAVTRLQQIVSLRALRLNLADVADLLDGSDADPLDIVERHRAALAAEITEAEQLRDHLGRIAGHLRAAERPSTDLLLRTIHATTMPASYYTPEQLQQLNEREAALGQAHVASVQEAWADLFADFERRRQAGVPPRAPELAPLVARADALIGAFTGGDDGLRQSLTEAVTENAGASFEAWGIEPALGSYYVAAMDADRSPIA